MKKRRKTYRYPHTHTARGRDGKEKQDLPSHSHPHRQEQGWKRHARPTLTLTPPGTGVEEIRKTYPHTHTHTARNRGGRDTQDLSSHPHRQGQGWKREGRSPLTLTPPRTGMEERVKISPHTHTAKDRDGREREDLPSHLHRQGQGWKREGRSPLTLTPPRTGMEERGKISPHTHTAKDRDGREREDLPSHSHRQGQGWKREGRSPLTLTPPRTGMEERVKISPHTHTAKDRDGREREDLPSHLHRQGQGWKREGRSPLTLTPPRTGMEERGKIYPHTHTARNRDGREREDLPSHSLR